jgi:hypothetical protein
VILFASGARATAQTDTADEVPSTPQDTFHDSRNPKVFLRHLAEDQARLWTSPLRLKPKDAEWLVPVGGITTGLIMTDRTAAFELSRGGHVSLSDNISNFGLGAYAGVISGLYYFGHRSGDLRK